MKRALFAFLLLALPLFMSAQEKRSTNIIKVHLVDSLTRNPLGFVTVYVSKDGSSDGAIYNLTDDAGRANLERVPNGKLIFKAEMMGYHTVTKNVTVSERITNLGTIAMLEDVQVLEQAVITAAGNPIVVKKDTIEYTASSFKTTDNDMLIELLKKLPGIEV
ncbi:MAG: carboxypeptidase-like regulatory domain-containing protein, partial [Bacteroidales bacterium]|nr:carboxypeptidase-like regulatory domain-containing protein [Bacteroidales bacterium]